MQNILQPCDENMQVNFAIFSKTDLLSCLGYTVIGLLLSLVVLDLAIVLCIVYDIPDSPINIVMSARFWQMRALSRLASGQNWIRPGTGFPLSIGVIKLVSAQFWLVSNRPIPAGCAISSPVLDQYRHITFRCQAGI